MFVIFQLCNKQSCVIFQLRRTKFEWLGNIKTCYGGSSHNVPIHRWFTITGTHHDNKMCKMYCWGPTNSNNSHFMVWCVKGVYCKLALYCCGKVRRGTCTLWNGHPKTGRWDHPTGLTRTHFTGSSVHRNSTFQCLWQSIRNGSWSSSHVAHWSFQSVQGVTIRLWRRSLSRHYIEVL